MADDSELLRQYVESDSEAAFSDLAHRYANLVYATALRITNDPHIAKDVTQTVFCAMARKASFLTSHPALSGWLHRSARYAAINAHRRKLRRTQLESEAQAMSPPNDSVPDTGDAADIAPMVDELLDHLNERERRAVMLRFFEECSFAEVGVRLRMKEDAARICVARALEKVRASLGRRGIHSTPGALTVFLASRAAIAAPAGVAAAASAAALSASAVSAMTGLSLLVFMTAKTKLIVAGLLVAGAGFVVYQDQSNRAQREQIAASVSAKTARLEDSQVPRGTMPEAKPEPALAGKPTAPVTASPLPAAAKPEPAAPQKFSPKIITQWNNAGRATPTAAFETLFWAAKAGRPAEATALVNIMGDDAIALRSVFESLSSPARELFVTPEFMFIAMNLTLGIDAGKDAEILNEVATAPDDVVLQYRWVGENRVRSMPLHRTDGAWSLQLSGLGLRERQEMWKAGAQSLADEMGKRRGGGATSNE